jgi:hypothetical protein
MLSISARAGPYFPSHGGGCRSHAGWVRPAFSAVAVAASISTAHTGECSPDSTWTECQLMRRRPTRRLSDVVMWRPSPASSSRLRASARAPIHNNPTNRRRIGPQLDFSCSASTGNARIRFPVAAKIALQIAGAIGGTPGSPTPPGGALLSMMYTWVSGVMSVRATR